MTNPSLDQELKIYDCHALTLQHNETYVRWVKRVNEYLRQVTGNSPVLKLNAYEAGQEILTFDVYSNEMSKSVAITIYLSSDTAILSPPIHADFECVLPGIQGVFNFVSEVVRQTEGTLKIG